MSASRSSPAFVRAGGFVCLAFALGVAGCATAYHAADEMGGYYQKKVPAAVAGNDDTYVVGFLANDSTSDVEVLGLAMRRAVELGRQMGYKYFSVEGRVYVPGALHGEEFTVRYFAEKPSGKFRDLHKIPEE